MITASVMKGLTKCINPVLILIDNIQNYDEVSLLCNKIEFAVFNIKNITERYCTLISLKLDSGRTRTSCPGEVFVNHF